MTDAPPDPTFLSTHAPPAGRPVLRELEATWRSLRGARAVPLRSDVDPGRLDAALPHAFVLERLGPGIARLRVAGQAVSAHLGEDARGVPFSQLFAPESREALASHLDAAFDGPALVELPVTCARSAFRPAVGGRMILLPLADSNGAVTRALGAILLDGAPGRGPRRFAIAEGAARVERLGEPALRRGLAEAERPWLRLVVSNR